MSVRFNAFIIYVDKSSACFYVMRGVVLKGGCSSFPLLLRLARNTLSVLCRGSTRNCGSSFPSFCETLKLYMCFNI